MFRYISRSGFWSQTNEQGAGDYDKNHILLRKRWHAATSRLLGKNKIDEMCHFSANQISKYSKKD